MSISERDGYPGQVTFDSTDYVPPDETVQPAKPTSPEPAHPPVPEGHIEITDPNHRLRPNIDLFVSSYCLTESHWNPHQWMYISETDADLISNWSGICRFCCPAEYHPSRQPAAAPPDPAPLAPAHPPVPEGHIEITDPNHRLRSGIDYALDLADPEDWWSKVEKATVGDNSHNFRFCCPAEYHPSQKLAFAVLSPGGLPAGFVEITDPQHNVRVGIDYYADRSVEKGVLWKLVQESSGNLSGFRFACPADKHPDLQTAPAPEPNGPSRATDNGTTLASVAPSLDAENVDLRRRVAELEGNNAAYSRKNDELRVLNEDLNHRLNATQARASRATELEGSLRGTAQHLLGHFQELEDRTKWSLRFADDGLLPAAYCKAMQHCQRRFGERFEVFLCTYPHVLPDIPEEYRPYDDSDDEMND